MLENRKRKRKPKKYEHLAITWSPVNQQWFVLWPGRGPVAQQQVLGRYNSLNEAEAYADKISGRELAANPRRKHPSKGSCRRITSSAISKERRAGVPPKQAVAIGLSKARRAGCPVPPGPRRMADNPTAFWGKYSV